MRRQGVAHPSPQILATGHPPDLPDRNRADQRPNLLAATRRWQLVDDELGQDRGPETTVDEPRCTSVT